MNSPTQLRPGTSGTCLSDDECRALLQGGLPDRELQPLLARLEGCPCCQEKLELLASAGDSRLAAVVADAEAALPPQDSAYWKVIKNVRTELTETFIPGRNHSTAETPAIDLPLDFLGPPTDPAYLGRLAHFDIARVIGRGGMGVVLEGFDTCLQRSVAIKVLGPELVNNSVAKQRFCREARAAAAITHDHVVAVHQVEYSESNGLPYIVMQLVQGETLEARMQREGQLPVEDAIRIIMQASAGLAAAHAQGLIHRDVKPGNILLEAPHSRVKLTDFGLARCVEDVRLTQSGFVTGTPLYMAPEQALGEDIDERSDLFSLGAVFYEMLAGQPPFAGITPLAVLKKITEDSPQPVSRLNGSVPPWLTDLIARLLDKRPELRPSSAAEVARILADRLTQQQGMSPLEMPSVACPKTSHQSLVPRHSRVQLWRGLALGLVAGIVLASLATWGGYQWGGYQSGSASKRNGAVSLSSDPTPHAMQPISTLKGNSGPVWSIAIAPDSESLAMAVDDGSIRIWDVGGTKVKSTIRASNSPVWATAFSADGKWVASGLDSGDVEIWNVASGESIRKLEIGKPVRTLAFAPTDNRLAIGCRTGELEVWNSMSGVLEFRTGGHLGIVMCVAWSPDGTILGSVGGDRLGKLWDGATGASQVNLTGHQGAVYSISFVKDGQRVVTGGWDRTLRIWDMSSGTELSSSSGLSEDIWSVACSPKADIAVSVGEDRMVRYWDLNQGVQLAALTGHTGTIYTVGFSHCGRFVSTAGRDGTARIWDVKQVLSMSPIKSDAAATIPTVFSGSVPGSEATHVIGKE